MPDSPTPERQPIPATYDPTTQLVRIEVGIGLLRVVQYITHEAFTFRVINWPDYYGPLINSTNA